MKKILLLLCALLTGVGVWADTYTWESKSGWTQASGGVANIYWFGAATPGTTTTEFTMSQFQIMQQTSGNTCYIAIATTNSINNNKLSESNVIAVSNNAVSPSSSTAKLETYTFDNDVTLAGGTTYYIVFLASNEPSNGAYSVQQGRISLNHTGYGTYAPGCSNASPSTWWPYYYAQLETTTKMINVTYNLYESDGTTLVSTVTTAQEPNSAVNIPSTLSGSTYYDYTTEGTIGTEDCTIKVIRTLKAGIVYPLTVLSNNKTYQISCPRGYLSTYNGTTLASTGKTTLGISAGEFAIITYEDNLYLFSVADSKFVQADGSLNTYPTDAVLTISEEIGTKPLFALKYGSNYVNTSLSYTYGFVINSWGGSGYWDDGNKYLIEEAGDFDSDALAAAIEKFTDRTPYYEALAEVIATAESIIGTGLGKYTKGDDYDAALSAAQTTYANADATISELEAAATALTTALGNATMNMPKAGMFLRMKSAHNTYLSAKESANQAGRLSFVTDADASTVFYFDGEKLTDLAKGVRANGREVGQVGNDGVTYWFEGSSIAIDKYAIRFNPDGKNDRYLYAWDTSKSYADQNSSDHANCAFVLEEVTTLPVAVSAAEYATLYAPVALAIAEGVTVYTISAVAEGKATLAKVEGTTIPAETAVILNAAEGTYNFAITEDVAAISGNLLEGVVVAKAWTDEFTLQTSDQGVGLFSKAVPYLAGFKAYLPANKAAGVKGILFDTETAVKSIEAAENKEKAIFDLSGRRVEKPVRGLYIVGGKKVIVK